MTKKNEETFDYYYTACGLNNVIIANMPARQDDAGDKVIEIPMINALHATLTMELATKESSLLPEELKFVRTEMGLTQAELAERIKKDHQTIGRWERGENPVDPTAEVIVRMLAFEHLTEIGFLTPKDNDQGDFSVRTISSKCVQAANGRPIKVELGRRGYQRVAA